MSEAVNKVLLVTVLLAGATEGCTPSEGDKLITTQDTTCWQYPGGEDASRLKAPLGQKSRGIIPKGTEGRVSKGPHLTSHAGFGWVRIELPKGIEFVHPPLTEELENFTPTDDEGNIIQVDRNILGQKTACWVKSKDLAKPQEPTK